MSAGFGTKGNLLNRQILNRESWDWALVMINRPAKVCVFLLITLRGAAWGKCQFPSEKAVRNT